MHAVLVRRIMPQAALATMVLACAAATGCWNTNHNRPASPNTRPANMINRSPEIGKANTPAKVNSPVNSATLNPNGNRVSGNVPMDLSHQVGLNDGAAGLRNNGSPPQFDSNVRPAGGLMPGNTNKNVTPIASNAGKANGGLSSIEPAPPLDPTPGQLQTPPAVPLPRRDANVNRGNPPPIPTSEIPVPSGGAAPIREIR